MNQTTIPTQRLKMLVDAITEQVVWLSFAPTAILPIIDPSLNSKFFAGHPGVDVYKEYEKFKLFYVNNKSFLVKDQSFETKQDAERIQFLRYKCQIFDILSSAFKGYSELIDLPNTTYLNFVNGSLKDEWINIYENIYNCSKENARKLLDFKINEHQKSNFILESAKLQMIEDLKNAKTIDDLKFLYDTTQLKVFNVNRYPLFT